MSFSVEKGWRNLDYSFCVGLYFIVFLRDVKWIWREDGRIRNDEMIQYEKLKNEKLINERGRERQTECIYN